jgi:glycosyltransferase involved in cell wall biosynthesis
MVQLQVPDDLVRPARVEYPGNAIEPSNTGTMNMCKPRVSIGLIVFNGERFLEETLDSLLVQTYPDFELIISDNASTDRTGEIARAYAAKDGRIRYHRNEKNLGVAGNHNRAFALAQGEYFKWATADDLCLPDHLARCVEVLDRDPTVVLVYPKTQFVDEACRPLNVHDPGWNLRSDQAHERLRYAILAGHWVNAVLGLIRTRALARTRLMPAYPGGDYRLLGELSLLGKFHEIPEYLFKRRIHAGASSQHAADGATPNAKWLIRYWKGEGRALSLPCWSLSIDRFRTIVRSRLSFQQKCSLIRSLFRHVRWQRGKLLNELWTAVTTYLPQHQSPAKVGRAGECG